MEIQTDNNGNAILEIGSSETDSGFDKTQYYYKILSGKVKVIKLSKRSNNDTWNFQKVKICPLTKVAKLVYITKIEGDGFSKGHKYKRFFTLFKCKEVKRKWKLKM